MIQGQTGASPPSYPPADSSPGIESPEVPDGERRPDADRPFESVDAAWQIPIADLLQSILEHAAGLLHANKSQLYLMQADSRTLRLAAARNLPTTPGRALNIGDGLAGRVAASAQAVSVTSDRQTAPATDVDIKSPFRCVGVPLSSHGQVLGVLIVVDDRSDAPFDAQQVQSVQLLADQAAISLENTQLLASAKHRADRFAALLETANELAVQHDLPKLLQTIVDRALALTGAAGGFIYLYDAAREEMELVIEHGMPVRPGIRLKLDEGMAGRVARSRRPLIVEDYQAWDERSSQFTESPYRSVVEVPMLFGGTLVGALGVYEFGESTRRYTEPDAHVLELLASPAASAVHNARLLQESQSRANEFEVLLETTRDLAAIQRDLPALLQTIVDRVLKLLQSTGGGMYLYDQARNDLYIAVATHFSTPVGTRMKMGEGMAGRVALTREPLIVDDYRTWPHRSPKFEGTPLTAIAEAPMLFGGDLVGVLVAEEVGETGHRFTESDARLLALFAGQAASAVHNARLIEQAQSSANEFSALYATAYDLATQQDLPNLLNTIIDRAVGLLHAAGGGIYLYHAARGDLVLEMATGMGPSIGEKRRLGDGLAGKAAATLQPIIVNDYPNWPDRSFMHEGEALTSVVTVPVMYGGELIGVLGVHEVAPNTRQFTESDARLLSLFAGQAAAAVHHTRLLEETRRRAQSQEALYQTSKTIARIQGVRELCDSVVRAATDFLGYPYVEVLLLEPSTGDRVAQTRRDPKQPNEYWRLAPGRGLSERAIQSGHLEYWPDLTQEPTYVAYDPGYLSEVDVPIKVGDTILGVLVAEERTFDAFDADDRSVLQAVANQLATAIDNTRLFEAERAHRSELGALYDLSRALADTHDPESVCSIVVRNAVETLGVTFARILLVEESDLVVGAAHPIRVLGCDLEVGRRIPIETGHMFQRVLEQIAPVIVRSDRAEMHDAEREIVMLGLCKTACLVPLRAGDRSLGILMLGEVRREEREPFTADKVRLAGSIADQAASALFRAGLRQETERRLRRVQALYLIDMAITSSLDLRVTLGILLEHVLEQLRADAADILLLEPYTLTLQYAAGRGFRSSAIEHSRVRLGEGYAGRAAMERKLVSARNLAEAGDFERSTLIAGEGFVSYFGVPLIAKGQVKGVLDIFVRSSFKPDPEWLEFLQALAAQAAIALDNSELFDSLQKSNTELAAAYERTLEGWSFALDLRDNEPEGHSHRVSQSAVRLARAMGMTETDVTHLHRGALLHDVGIMGVPDSILNKKGALSGEEWEIMRKHPTFAYELLSRIAYLRPALDIPYCHHERWDGTGYPRRLSGEQIPLAARIFSVVDAWDSLRTDRPFREAWSDENAREYIQEQSGQQFDPGVVDAFLRILAYDDRLAPP